MGENPRIHPFFAVHVASSLLERHSHCGTQWHLNLWLALEELHFFPNGACVWFQFQITLVEAQEQWHWVGHGPCRNILQHGSSWHSLRLQSALNPRFLVVGALLPANKETDNSAADAASAKGLSMTPAVSAVLAPYFKFMRRYHVFPKMTHVPGHLNTIADSLSRFKQPLPEPLTVSNHCLVRWQELLASSPVCIAQTGRKWPSKFGIDVKKALRQSADCGFLQSIYFGEFSTPAGRFSILVWCLFKLPTCFNQFATPLLGMYICVVILCWGVTN